MVEHLRTALELAGDVAAANESDRTLWRHREYARARLGVTYKPAEARAVAEDAIRSAVTTKDKPADLINVALEELSGRAACGWTGRSLCRRGGSGRSRAHGLAGRNGRRGGSSRDGLRWNVLHLNDGLALQVSS